MFPAMCLKTICLLILGRQDIMLVAFLMLLDDHLDITFHYIHAAARINRGVWRKLKISIIVNLHITHCVYSIYTSKYIMIPINT